MNQRIRFGGIKGSIAQCFLSGVLFVSAISNAVAEEQIVKIVSSLPRTGSANAQTTTMVNAIRMAIDDVGGKVGDFKIVYEDWDDASPERGQCCLLYTSRCV